MYGAGLCKVNQQTTGNWYTKLNDFSINTLKFFFQCFD